MLKILSLGILLGAIPLALGLPWTKLIRCRYRIAFSYGVGYFVEQALFFAVALPVSLLTGSFGLVKNLFTCSLVICSVFCILFSKKHGLFSGTLILHHIRKVEWYEWLLLSMILFSVGIQIIRGFTYEMSYMSWDDATYTVIAQDTLAMDQFGLIDPYTGAATYLDYKRIFQTSLIFPSYLSAMTGITVPIIEHTIQYIQMLLLAYTIFLYMTGELFEKRINRLIFILVISVLFTYGYYSHYTLTFRLLGPNYQGKAVLAISLTPMVFTILMKKLSEPYEWETGTLLCILSLAAVSLTLWGTGTMIVIVALPVILSLFRKERNWKHLYYIPWACVIPAGIAAWHLANKLAV